MAISKQVLDDLIGEVVATNVSLEDYMEHYAEQHCEWVEGVVIKMPGSLKHNRLIYFLYGFFNTYFGLRPIGQVIGQPFVMRLPAFPNRRREPDLMILLDSSKSDLKDSYLDGAADICIEVVSEESVERDHGDKFREYEVGGVPEYWIVDPLHDETRFYGLNEQGRYVRQSEDGNGIYRTPLLPDLALHVPTLWQDDLPDIATTVHMIMAMLNEGQDE